MQGRGPEEGLGCRKSKSKRGSLGCWTSAIEADIYRTGELVSKRMDVLVSRDFSVSKGLLPVPCDPMHALADGEQQAVLMWRSKKP